MLQEKIVASKGEARRLIQQNAVSFSDGARITNPEQRLDESFHGKTLKIGKRKFIKLC
jgi:tyrosyl-tRNA synthetase